MLSWCVHRDIFYSEVRRARGCALVKRRELRRPWRAFQLARIRNEFEKHRAVTDPAVIDGLLSRGEARLEEYSHPDKYTSASLSLSSRRCRCVCPLTPRRP